MYPDTSMETARAARLNHRGQLTLVSVKPLRHVHKLRIGKEFPRCTRLYFFCGIRIVLLPFSFLRIRPTSSTTRVDSSTRYNVRRVRWSILITFLCILRKYTGKKERKGSQSSTQMDRFWSAPPVSRYHLPAQWCVNQLRWL